MIEIKNLSKSYSTKPVFENLNLIFTEGSVYGIIGENGAGKTTFFKCLCDIENYSGSIIYDKGILKNTIGYLPTDLFFFSRMTGREYLQLLCTARGLVSENFDEKNIFDLPLDQYADTYSTGMKKKLALTALLLQQNQVFILDEPFNGVDIQSNIVIREIILKLKELNKIVVISSHIFSTLHETCDYLHLLKNGSISAPIGKDGFLEVENEMKNTGIGFKIDRLNLK